MNKDQLNLSSGRWISRESLITNILTEYADDEDLDRERMTRLVDEMIEDDDVLRNL